MSFAGPINLPSPARGGTHYTKYLLRAYLYALNPAAIRTDVASHGKYLARGENEVHESIALEKLKLKLKIVLDGVVESRKNSFVNTLSYNLDIGNDGAVASMFASIWRRLLGETSLKKAKMSAYGYALNCNNRSKGGQKKEIKALCEWCRKEISVHLNKGFTCPCCGVHFQNYKPQTIKIKKDFDCFYFEDFEKDNEHGVLEKIKTGEFELKKAKKSKTAQLVLNLDTNSKIRWSA